MSFPIALTTASAALMPVLVSHAQNSPKTPHNSMSRNRILERLTLLLVDRLPTSVEREFWLSRGNQSITQLADLLVASPDFFHRQAFYWQSQFNKSPAWKWEGQQNPYELNLDTIPLEKRRRFLVYTAPSQSNSLARSCTGVWTITSEGGSPQPCSCGDAVDLLPFWDKSSPMRVCPVAVSENQCGQSLEMCFPVDRRLSPSSTGLAIDRDTAGGLAIDRLLTDLNLTHGRALALRVIGHQRWSQLSTLPFQTVMSRSSIALLNQMNQILQNAFSLQLSQLLRFSENAALLEQTLAKPLLRRNRVYGFKALGLPSAEAFLLSTPLNNLSSLRPLRFSKLSERVWKWNNNLIFSCASPLVAQQQFPLPLPHPDKAKSAAYFCSGCHMALDANVDQPVSRSEKTESSKNSVRARSECAVDHAIRFLTGSNPLEFHSSKLKEVAKRSFKENEESLAAVIRDLAIEMARRSSP